MVQPTPIPSTLVDPPHPPAFSCPSPDANRASNAWYTRGKPSLQLPARMSGDAAIKPSSRGRPADQQKKREKNRKHEYERERERSLDYPEKESYKLAGVERSSRDMQNTMQVLQSRDRTRNPREIPRLECLCCKGERHRTPRSGTRGTCPTD